MIFLLVFLAAASFGFGWLGMSLLVATIFGAVLGVAAEVVDRLNLFGA